MCNNYHLKTKIKLVTYFNKYIQFLLKTPTWTRVHGDTEF